MIELFAKIRKTASTFETEKSYIFENSKRLKPSEFSGISPKEILKY